MQFSSRFTVFVLHFLFSQRTFLSRLFGAFLLGPVPPLFPLWSTGPSLLILTMPLSGFLPRLVPEISHCTTQHTSNPGLMPARLAMTSSMSSLACRTASEPCRFRALPIVHSKCNGHLRSSRFVPSSRPENRDPHATSTVSNKCPSLSLTMTTSKV